MTYSTLKGLGRSNSKANLSLTILTFSYDLKCDSLVECFPGLESWGEMSYVDTVYLSKMYFFLVKIFASALFKHLCYK